VTEPDDAEKAGLWARLMAWVGRIIAWVTALKPVRVFTHYAESRGPILASGLAFQAIFAVFGGLWVGFSIAGIVIQNNIGLRTSLIEVLAQTVPGLINTDSADGIVDPETLLAAGAFEWTAVIALLVLFFAALNWLAAARDATRVIVELPPDRTNFLLLKAKDLGLAVGFGALLLLSAGLSVVGTIALEAVLQWAGIRDSTLSTVLGRTVTLSVMFVLDAFVLGMLYRVLAGVRIPLGHLWQGALLGAVGLGGLKVLGSALLGGASNNPLLASFAVLLGLLIWFNFACQVILLGASWIAIGVADDQLILDEKVAAQRLERARALVKAHEPDPEPEKRPWYRRLFARD
jgi:membrane protein